ncbi:MAG: Nif3-like dinuclear metal center hexameric protein [Bacillota bacterium]
MLATVGSVMAIMEEWARPDYAEPWDNPGLVTGEPQDEAGHIIVALDLTLDLIEAAPPGAMVVCHHPPLFKEVRTLRSDRPTGKILGGAIQKRMAVYAAHTNLDLAPGGTADALAGRLELEDMSPLAPLRPGRYYKLVVFVPAGHEDAVRHALAAAGAGWIGNYSHCTFQLPGQGTFMPREGTDPFIGKPGKLERVDEFRLETIVPDHRVEAVVSAMVSAHPYEEVAYDLYPLENPGPGRSYGRVGRPKSPASLREYAEFCQKALGVESVRYLGQPHVPVRRVAVVPGAGGDWALGARAAGADVLVTGDVGHHEAVSAAIMGMAVIDAGHLATEWPVLEVVADRIMTGTRQAGLVTSLEVWPARPLFFTAGGGGAS